MKATKHSEPTARRVPVDFCPRARWSIDVGTVGSIVTHRPICGFAPIELVIAAATKKRAQWQVQCCAPLWAYQF